MIQRHLISVLLLLVCTSLFGQKKSPLVVVELFTSEGCSSCPAADELLEKMAMQRETEGKPIIALAFHVTYWNHLGWIDTYSKEAYTNRQKAYAAVFEKSQMYTPQAVVNGRHEFVGSNAVAFNDTLAKAEKRKNSFEIEANARLHGDSIEIEYVVDESKNQLMNIALIEKNSVHSVSRGENKNRTLRHFNVVREFKTHDLKSQKVMFAPIEDVPVTNMEVILFVQHKKTMRIGGR